MSLVLEVRGCGNDGLEVREVTLADGEEMRLSSQVECVMGALRLQVTRVYIVRVKSGAGRRWWRPWWRRVTTVMDINRRDSTFAWRGAPR